MFSEIQTLDNWCTQMAKLVFFKCFLWKFAFLYDHDIYLSQTQINLVHSSSGRKEHNIKQHLSLLLIQLIRNRHTYYPSSQIPVKHLRPQTTWTGRHRDNNSIPIWKWHKWIPIYCSSSSCVEICTKKCSNRGTWLLLRANNFSLVFY